MGSVEATSEPPYYYQVNGGFDPTSLRGRIYFSCRLPLLRPVEPSHVVCEEAYGTYRTHARLRAACVGGWCSVSSCRLISCDRCCLSCCAPAAVHCSEISGAAASGEVWSGCSREPGYRGSIAPSTEEPYYTGAFVAVQCPPEATGLVPNGCSPKAGYSGGVTPSLHDPFYNSTLAAVGCPQGSEATDISGMYPRGTVPDGCRALAGYKGTVIPQTAGDFYISTLEAADCPNLGEATEGTVPGQSGTNGTSGCNVLQGWAGSVTATTTPPYYNSAALAGQPLVLLATHVVLSAFSESTAVLCSFFRVSGWQV